MQFLRKAFIAAIVGLFIQGLALANSDTQISRYEQAKLRLSYEGDVGNLLQQLSQRLKVGFIAYDVDISRKVSIQNKAETTIKAINEQITSQLADADVRFENIGNRLFIIISAKDGEPLLQNVSETQFVGDIVFEGEEAATTTPPQLQNIFDIATDEALLAKAKDKKAPQYKITTKERLALKNIRVTALGTFLIFESDVDATKFTVKGKFEDMAQGENIVAILHQQGDAPSKIEIENAEGKKLVLEAQKAASSKTEKKKGKK
ncbi:hypothetical protein PTQ27_08270 [Mannheimia sp. AT1]|uniref:Uncharacterized protein n=1 Tax=Mannheimia cairinae TaxID=3025936 RepID=A0ABT5MS88_9PAST|nr:hypothetical protein [Mannheimia cairinae]MDD0824456.1 hypothetical protein [Mannheimia cairinae]MDD0825557.1 hypothetical protein [Mannheimia cairinae]